MPYVSVDETRLYYDESGEGPPLLFLHGLGSSGHDWADQARRFSDDYRVLRMDLRGHGRSERPRGPYHISQFARDVAVFLRKLEAAPAHVVGLSMGGMVALELGANAPELLQSLVVVNSVADSRLDSWGDVWFYLSRRLAVQVLGMRRVGTFLAEKLFVHAHQEALRREFRRRWAQNDQDAYLRSMDAIRRWSVMDRLERITAPTLVLGADHDYTPVSTKIRLAGRLPNARLEVIKDAHHALPVERPDAFERAVRRFLEEVGNVRGERDRLLSARSSPH